MHRVTKTWGHDFGLSVCFRQWRASSHCHLTHGYALAISVEFEAKQLDPHGWVIDFGGLRGFTDQLRALFDHKTVVAADDPALDWFKEGQRRGLVELVTLPAVGCEAFAEVVCELAKDWLQAHGHERRVRVVSATVREHGANSASYCP